MNSPILVWMLYLNREVTKEEYEKCYELIHNTVPHAKNIPSNPSSGESLRRFARLGPSLHNFN
jgi:4'-phosphopantetheinyl transferase